MLKESMTWEEALSFLSQYNSHKGFTRRDSVNEICTIAAVVTKTDKEVPEKVTYLFTNNNKAFLKDELGSSIYAHTENTPELEVRIEKYVGLDKWKVESCYVYQPSDTLREE